jgi:hypothetical protein
MLGRYIENPSKYLESFNRGELERLRANPPSPAEGPDAAVLYHQCVLQLDPTDAESKAELTRLNAKDPTSERNAVRQKSEAETAKKKAVKYDPDADYKVFLESIDLNQETAATFALKLSMRIRSPLPRIMSIVKYMPTSVGGRLPIRKAKKLAKIIDELGGVARIEVHPIDESTGSHDPAKKKAGRAAQVDRSSQPQSSKSRRSAVEHEVPAEDGTGQPDPDLGKTVEHHPINERADGPFSARPKKPSATRKCPKCGWDEDADAGFCSICMVSFNKTEPLSLEELQGRRQSKNPLAVETDNGHHLGAGPLDKFRELPSNVKYGGLAALIVLLLLIVFGR